MPVLLAIVLGGIVLTPIIAVLFGIALSRRRHAIRHGDF